MALVRALSAGTPVARITGAVGATPLVRLHPTGCDDLAVWAKLEAANPGGSAKDRTALAMVTDALATGRLSPGGRVVESSSGNFGVAMSMVAAAYDLRFTCVVDPRANRSNLALMRSLGAEVVEVTEPDPETGDWLAARINRVRQIASEQGAVWLDQYANPAAVEAHRFGTMTEIADALDDQVDWLFVATSTTGTLAGCLALVRERALPTKVVAVDAQGSVLFGGTRGERHLPGYGAGIVPALSRNLVPDEVVRVADIDAVLGCRALARREGILAGGSSGAVCSAFRSLRPRIAPGANVVLIFADGGAGYVDTVYSDAWVEETLGVTGLDDRAASAW